MTSDGNSPLALWPRSVTIRGVGWFLSPITKTASTPTIENYFVITPENLPALSGGPGWLLKLVWSGLDRVLGQPAVRTTVLCAESVWWRCHRRMISDCAVLARNVPVEHLMPAGRRQTHRPTEDVRLREDGLLVYDGNR